jgi:ubiquinone biosynthesis protein COQ4
MLAEKPSLLAALSDRAALRACRRALSAASTPTSWTRRSSTPPDWSKAEETATQTYGRPDDEPVDPEREFFGDRVRDMHDLWHVLTGYGRDEAGEAANLAFTYAQVPTSASASSSSPAPSSARTTCPSTGNATCSAPIAAAGAPPASSPMPYEELLPLPLAEVRRRLAIEPPRVAHPEGILVASRGEEPRWRIGDEARVAGAS